MTMSIEAIEIFLAKGKRGVLLERDALTREEKDVIRERFGAEGSAGIWFLEVSDEESEETELEAQESGDFKEEQADVTSTREEGGEPTLEDLEALKLPELKELAAKEQVDISDLKLKADILGRLAVHFGVGV